MGHSGYFTATKSHCLLPLSQRPTILQRGVGVHGSAQKPSVERFRLGLWSLHLYTYSATLVLDGVAFSLTPGSVGLTPPNTEIEYRFAGRSTHFYVHFALPELAGDTRIPALQPVSSALAERLRAWSPRPLALEVALWSALFALSEPNEAAPDTISRPVQQLLVRIDEGLSGPLSVAELAGESTFSHGYLTRLFREATGKTIAGYIAWRRLERARHLLRHSTLSVKEIAAQVGIPSLGTFHRTFFRVEGVGPRAWRERVQSGR